LVSARPGLARREPILSGLAGVFSLIATMHDQERVRMVALLVLVVAVVAAVRIALPR